MLGNIDVDATVPEFGGINSVAVSNGIIAVAVENAVKSDNGFVAFYSTADGSLINIVEVGALPDMPLLIAFVVLALYTYSSGLRAPALIAVVKDFLIYATVLAAVIVIPSELGGYGKIFAAVPPKSLLLPPAPSGSLGAGFSYASLALGSALALFLYPHSITGLLSASSRGAIRRNAQSSCSQQQWSSLARRSRWRSILHRRAVRRQTATRRS